MNNGINKKVLSKIMDMSTKLQPKPSFYVSLGDCVAGSSDNNVLQNQLLYFKNICKEFVPFVCILPVVGNHEVNSIPKDITVEHILRDTLFNFKKKNKLQGYNDTVYFMDLQNSRFIFLNTHHYGEVKKIADKQLQWLKEACKTDKRFKFIFMHAPAFPTGAHVNKSLDIYPNERDKLWKVIDENNINIVFSGHEHNYSRRVIDSDFSTPQYEFKNKIYQIISGGGGETLKQSFKSKKGVIVRPKAKHHFIIVDIDTSRVTVESVAVDGDILDKFII